MKREIESQGLKRNFIFQTLYQLIILVMPLIVSPFLTRTIGDTALGIYTYTYSIAYYFVLFAMLGISKHGQRIIANRRDDKIALRKTFWSLYFVHLIFSIFAIILYILFVFFCGGEYQSIYLIQTLYVASALFDVTWLFYGLENFKSVVVRNLIIKIIECSLIFSLIKSSSDLYIYTLIMSASLFLGQAIMLPQAIFYVKPIRINWIDVKEHIKPLFVLFIAVIASTLYTVFDKTLLGLMTNPENVAYYEYSNKIINIPKIFISVIGTVMFPRACASLAKGDSSNSHKYMYISLHLICFIGIGSIFGLLGVSNLFSILYYGSSFSICGDVIILMSPVIIIVGVGEIIRTQFMIPKHMDKLFTICLVTSAIINIILNIIIIPVLGIYGAVVGTLAAELIGLIFQLIVCRKFMPFTKVILTMVPYIILGAVMFGVIYLIKLYFNTSLWDLLLQITVGGGAYCILCTIYLLCLSPIKNNLRLIIRSIIHRKKKVSVVESNDEKSEN